MNDKEKIELLEKELKDNKRLHATFSLVFCIFLLIMLTILILCL